MKLVFFHFFAAMNLVEAKKYFRTECEAVIDVIEGDEIFVRLVEVLTGKSRIEIKLNLKLEIDSVKFEAMVEELKKNKPVQYVVGYEWFCNLKLKVNESVLIPRPETEELVKWVLKTMKEKNLNNATIIDIGTGSGCIPISLKKEIGTLRVSALDISEDALKLATENATLHEVDINFFQYDILQPNILSKEHFDVIVSNPPYISEDEKVDMSNRVLEYEPHLALFVTNSNPLQFYQAILRFAMKYLSLNGIIFLELNDKYATSIEKLFCENGFDTELRKDMYGNTRMMKAHKKT